jgi:hypothetical protein
MNGFLEARLVYPEADQLGLEIDHDDSPAALPGPSFALLIQGIQPKGSAGQARVKAADGGGLQERRGRLALWPGTAVLPPIKHPSKRQKCSDVDNARFGYRC